MKHFKRIAAAVISVMMVFAMCVSTLAATINVTGGQVGQVYYAYKIFDLETDATNTNFTYTIAADSQFLTLVQTYAATESNGMQLTAHYTDATQTTVDYYVVTVTENAASNNFSASAFAAYLKEAIESGAYTYAATATAAYTGEVGNSTIAAELTASDTGYYFINSDLGSLAILRSTTDTVDVEEKNTAPSTDKTVSSTADSTGSDTTSASVGDTVYYTVKINVGKGEVAYDFTVTDVLSKGLTFNSGSVQVFDSDHATIDGQGNVTNVSEYWTSGTDYTLDPGTYNSSSGTTITIVLKSADNGGTKLSNLTDSTDYVYITYSATVNENAVIGTTGNGNDVEVDYGRDSSYTSNTSTAEVDTFRFGVEKTANGSGQLAGVVFSLKDSSGNSIYVVPTTGSITTYSYYRVATADEISGGFASDTITTTSGKTIFWIEGLEAGTYTLTEEDAPAGYAKLVGTITVTIGTDGSVSFSANSTSDSSLVDTSASSTGYVTIDNKSGSSLPTTGGMGTRIFYVAGIILVVCAGILLITKRRMSSAK